jgi:hypothetical protein
MHTLPGHPISESVDEYQTTAGEAVVPDDELFQSSILKTSVHRAVVIPNKKTIHYL